MKVKQFFFVLLGAGVALLALGAWGYVTAISSIKMAGQELSKQEAEQLAADRQIESLNKLQNQYNHNIVPILPLINEALPQTKNQTAVLAQLKQVAAESGISLGNITFISAQGLPSNVSQTVVSTGALAMPISFDVHGSFGQLQTFLSKVETLSRYTNVTTLTVSRQNKSQPVGYAITVNVFVKP